MASLLLAPVGGPVKVSAELWAGVTAAGVTTEQIQVFIL